MAGVDPKSVVCEFFRHGQCAKGFKCKYSHDLSVERKGEKIDIYSDQRDGRLLLNAWVSLENSELWVHKIWW